MFINNSAVIIILCFMVICIAADDDKCNADSVTAEKTLHKKLLCNYDKTMRPRRSVKEAVNVTIRMVVKTFKYSYEFSSIGILNMGTWVVLNWKDDFLQWDPKNHEDMDQTVMHSSTIWTPDLSLYNSVSGPNPNLNIPCLVRSDGSVTCIPHMMYKAVCSSSYKEWPKDKQNCTLTFGTWMHKGEEVSFLLAKKQPMDTRVMEPNKFWKVVAANADRHGGVYACCPNTTYPTVSFWMVIERHSAHALIFLLTPAIVMIMMTLTSLCMDIMATERLALMMLNLYCHILYLKEVSTYVPAAGDDVPNAVIYFRDSMLLSAFVLLEGIGMRSIVKKTSAVPRWIITVTGVMNTRPGKIIMFHEFDPASDTMVTEDTENLTKEEMDNSSRREWTRFAIFSNRIFFIVVFITYCGLFLAYLLT